MTKLLQTISNDNKFRQDVSKYLLEFVAQLKKFDFFKASQSKKRLSALESGQFFADCIGAMEHIFAPHIQAYSAMRWMYYLRRTPNSVFSGDLRSTVANNRALSEIYAQRSERVEEARWGQAGFEFRLDDCTLRHVARFAAFVIIMNDLQVDFRFASKGGVRIRCRTRFQVVFLGHQGCLLVDLHGQVARRRNLAASACRQRRDCGGHPHLRPTPQRAKHLPEPCLEARRTGRHD